MEPNLHLPILSHSKGGDFVNRYQTKISKGQRKILKALGFQVIDIPKDEVIAFPINSSTGYYLPKSSSQ